MKVKKIPRLDVSETLEEIIPVTESLVTPPPQSATVVIIQVDDEVDIEEAVKVVRSLLNMAPGIQRGKPVGVQYALPIIFDVRAK